MLTGLVMKRPIAIFDLETTGTDPKNDRVIEISILKLKPGAEPDHRTRRINPGRPIPAEATAVHGITDADVEDKPLFSELAPGLRSFLNGCDLCGYNLLRFDLRLLLNEFNRVGISFPLRGRRILDPCRIFHQREPRNLAAALQFYCGHDHDGAHGAEADVLATVAVLEAQLGRYTDLPRSVDELHEHLRDPTSVDLDGMFTRNGSGAIEFARGKYKGRTLQEIATSKPDYLQWILREDFFEDVKSLVSEALNAVYG
jgi:DNA polymerase-3 subunit epsilon